MAILKPCTENINQTLQAQGLSDYETDPLKWFLMTLLMIVRMGRLKVILTIRPGRLQIRGCIQRAASRGQSLDDLTGTIHMTFKVIYLTSQGHYFDLWGFKGQTL